MQLVELVSNEDDTSRYEISYRLSAQRLRSLVCTNHYWHGLTSHKLGELRRHKLALLEKRFPAATSEDKEPQPLIFRVVATLVPSMQANVLALRDLLDCAPHSSLQTTIITHCGIAIEATAAEVVCLSSHVPQRAVRLLLSHAIKHGNPQELYLRLGSHIARYSERYEKLAAQLSEAGFDTAIAQPSIRHCKLDGLTARIDELEIAQKLLLSGST
jgi:hypothetical protein